MAMTAASILLCVVLLNFHHRDSSTRIPIWLKHVTFQYLAPLACMRTQVKTHLDAEYTREQCERSLRRAHNGSVRSGCSRHSSVRAEGFAALTDFELEHQNHFSDVTESSFNDDVSGVRRSFRTQYRERQRKRAVIEEIVRHIRQITRKLDESDDEAVLLSDCKMVAKILDRTLLMLFTVLVVLSSVFMLVVFPLFQKSQ